MDLMLGQAQAFAWPWRPSHPIAHPTIPLPSPTTIKHNNNINNNKNNQKKKKYQPLQPGILTHHTNPGNESKEIATQVLVSLPKPPAIPSPRATYNAASLAYLGDCVYELYARCHYLSPPKTIDQYNSLVTDVVCCEAQDVLIRKLLRDDQFLTAEERDILRWGRNIDTGQKRATRRAGFAAYSSASSLETLIGYLYLTNPIRLQMLMRKLGFGVENNET